jgi:hypothetical protein
MPNSTISSDALVCVQKQESDEYEDFLPEFDDECLRLIESYRPLVSFSFRCEIIYRLNTFFALLGSKSFNLIVMQKQKTLS